MVALYVFSISLSAILLALAFVVGRSRFGTGGVCYLAIAGAVVSCVGVSLAVLLQSALMFVLALACLACRAKPKAVFASAAFAAIAGHAVVTLSTVVRLHEHYRLQQEYPVESVARRLAYEAGATEASADGERSAALSGQVERRLRSFEERGTSNTRSYMLRALHDKAREQFIAASGFGSVRMRRVQRERIELPEGDPLPIPSPSYSPEVYSPEPDSVPMARGIPSGEEGPSYDDLMSMHVTGLEDFLEPERMGYVEAPMRVAGFQSHRFLAIPRLASEDQASDQWQVSRLELVSLLKHDVPVAYVSRLLPRMDQLADSPTRPLDGFETAAIEQLRHDEDLVIQDGLGRIRMVGSIRAAKDCLDCHSVDRGHLLGAFTYELVPEPPQVKRPPAPSARPAAASL